MPYIVVVISYKFMIDYRICVNFTIDWLSINNRMKYLQICKKKYVN